MSDIENVQNESTQELVQEHQPVAEKTLTVSQVNALVGREKAAAAEKARRETEERYKQELDARQSNNVDMDSVVNRVKAEMIEERQRLEEESKKAQLEAYFDKSAKEYVSKMEAEKLPENFEDPMGLISNPLDYYQLVFLANEVDNTAAVIKELAQKPTKLASLHYMAKDNPKAAKNMLKKISDSIKNNKDAAQSTPKTNAPLSQLKPSTVGSGSGKMGLSDFKKADWLRG